MLRTSMAQFEVLIKFMERHCDLNKPADGPQGRINNIEKWRELTNILNFDPTGLSKSIDKWKKVWSDFKNNTKRKAARIHRAALGTGGGPACKLVLSDLEQRVLSITGTQAATGIGVEEVGVEDTYPPPAAEVPPTPTLTLNVSQAMDNVDDLERPSTSHQNLDFVIAVVEEAVSPTEHHTHVGTPGRPGVGRVRRRLSTPRRMRPRNRPGHDAAEQFISNEQRWQSLARDFITENVRLRDAELQQQAQWQNLFAKLISLIDLVINKF